VEPIRLELPTGLDVGPVNIYLFRQPEPVLVDIGLKSPESWDALQFALAEHNLTVMDISRVIITHPHIDHYGQVGTVAAHSDADIWICELGARWLTDAEAVWQERLAYYRDSFIPGIGFDPLIAAAFANGMNSFAELYDPAPPERVHTFAADGLLQMGGMAWQVIHTPGHSSAQTCFYQPETRQLLSADHLLKTTPTPVVERPLPPARSRTPALPQFMRSLGLIKSLDIEAVYPGHGRPFGRRFNQDHHPIIEKQCRRIRQRKAECLGHIQAGIRTPATLLDVMYAHHPPQIRFAGLWMLIGYLDLLLEDGAIRQETVDGVWHYFGD
jgi:glyoxylase-like metal-dependent hydrolase (beta-lactamase superfamily II)